MNIEVADRLLESVNVNLVDHLLESMNFEKINYCHWKSNIDLAQATSGEMDLDFLVDRESFQPLISILSRLGFRSTLVRWGANTPGISHFYGYDSTSGRFAHVHLFSRVITGESFLKSHLLPFESMLLQNTRFDGQMRVTSKSAELVLFTIRTFIKYGSLLDLMYLYKKSEKLRTEINWLKDGSDLPTTLSLLKKCCPVIDEQLFIQCMNTIDSNASLRERIGLARKVRSRIRGYSKYSFFEWLTSMTKLAFNQLQRRTGSKKKNKVFQAGGAIIAIVGADATGKSTVVSEVSKWLGENFLVRNIHAGKPPTSLVTAPVNMALNIFRRLLPKSRSAVKEEHSASENHKPSVKRDLARLLYAIRAVTLAYDRRYLLLKSWRAAAKGDIFICDRYPSTITGAMDSPRLEEITERKGWLPSIYNWAARFEKDLYTQIPPPDIVFRLHVSVETAKERNRLRIKPGDEESDEYIEARHQQTAEWHRTDTERIYDIDTGQPLADTLFTIKNLIWNTL